jgi:hypothetical protein
MPAATSTPPSYGAIVEVPRTYALAASDSLRTFAHIEVYDLVPRVLTHGVRALHPVLLTPSVLHPRLVCHWHLRATSVRRLYRNDILFPVAFMAYNYARHSLTDFVKPSRPGPMTPTPLRFLVIHTPSQIVTDVDDDDDDATAGADSDDDDDDDNDATRAYEELSFVARVHAIMTNIAATAVPTSSGNTTAVAPALVPFLRALVYAADALPPQ